MEIRCGFELTMMPGYLALTPLSLLSRPQHTLHSAPWNLMEENGQHIIHFQVQKNGEKAT